MTKIKIRKETLNDEKSLVIEIAGHAGAAAMGQDLICAGISTMAVSLAKYLREKGKGEYCIQEKAGNAEFVIPEKHIQNIEAILFGFRWMADSFPEYVSIEEDA